VSYTLEFGSEAVTDLARVPVAMRDCVEKALEAFRQTPASVSRRRPMPYPEDVVIHEFDCHEADQRRHFSVHFRYKQDEQTIIVLRLGQYDLG